MSVVAPAGNGTMMRIFLAGNRSWLRAAPGNNAKARAAAPISSRRVLSPVDGHCSVGHVDLALLSPFLVSSLRPPALGFAEAFVAFFTVGQFSRNRCSCRRKAGRPGCSTCGIKPDVLAHDAGPKLNLKISVDNLLASAQVFGAAEVALDDIDEFPVEVTVIDRGHEREHGHEHREVGHHGGSNCDLALAHRRSLTPPSSPDSRPMP